MRVVLDILALGNSAQWLVGCGQLLELFTKIICDPISDMVIVLIQA